MANLAGVDELDLAFAFLPLVLGKNPDISRNARIVEQVRRQSDDSFNEVLFQKPAADLTFTGRCTARKERRPVFDDGVAAEMVIHLVDGRLEEEHLHIPRTRQTRTPAAFKAFVIFVTDRFFYTFCGILAAPGLTKRRIFQNKAHLIIGKPVS